jgi:UDP-GlcNAc:undecaprenyl-phosphate GlcNAc-1-phosphate transferase
MLSLYLSAAAAFVATVALAFLLRPVARSLDFVDRPGGRKLHAGEVPVIGGIAMFVGLALGVSMLPDTVRPAASFAATAFGFVCLGLLDDRLNLSSKLRLLVQIGAVLVMAVWGNLGVHYVGAPFAAGTTIFVPGVALFVTVMLVVGAVNALNMVDGIDGLAGSLGLVGLIFVGGVAFVGANVEVLSVAVVLGAAVVGFLVFNLPLGINGSLRIFMGDAGSMLLGFSLAWMMVALSQEPSTPVAPVTLLWFAAVPIFDMVSTATGRLRRGVSPMSADNTHFHHRLMRRGFSTRRALVALVGLAVFWAAVGVSLDAVLRAPEWVSLVAFLVAGGVTSRALTGRREASAASEPRVDVT